MKRLILLFVASFLVVITSIVSLNFVSAQEGLFCNGNDVDIDGDVDSDDIALVRKNFGMECLNDNCQGDVNLDGFVDANDLASIRINFGRTDCTGIIVEFEKEVIGLGERVRALIIPTEYSIYNLALIREKGSANRGFDIAFPCSFGARTCSLNDIQVLNELIPVTAEPGIYVLVLTEIIKGKYLQREFEFEVIDKKPGKLQVSLDPNSMVQGDYLRIYIRPGEEGIDDEIQLLGWSVSGLILIDVIDISNCANHIGGKCFGNAIVSYFIPGHFSDGTYYIRINDFTDGRFRDFSFRVV